MKKGTEPRRILVAEDNAVSRLMLESLLGKWGFEVQAVTDGCRAYEALTQAGAPRLAILDWEMPGMDGVQVCRKIREIETDDPPYLIMLTSHGDRDDVVEGLDAGANDYIAKPFYRAELRARVDVGCRMLELRAQLKHARDALAYEAMHDPLTGIFNRRAILSMLRKELARAAREDKPLSVGLCDIDHFKQVNDTYGHQTGDDVLCGLVQRVQGALRSYDHFGRYGGEEFLVLVPGATGAAESNLYERLRAAVANDAIHTRSGAVAITVSIGVAEGTGEAAMDAVLAAADAALYRAKSEGRNRIAGPGGV